MKNYIRAVFIILSLAVFSNGAYAAWGDYDTTFGILGGALDSIPNHYPRGVAVQADGKILVTGYRIVAGKERFFLRRYLSNGQVDTSFGNNGSAIWTSFIVVDADYRGERIVVQANGRIAVAGRGNGNQTIWRFLSSGSADTSIGSGGMKKVSTSSWDVTPGIATHSNLLYVGVVAQESTSIIKFNSNGTQDMSFGSSGMALTDAGFSFSMAVDPTTGNILVSGRRRSDPSDYGIERFLTNGVLDPSFNHWNATYTGFPGSNPSEFVRLANGEFVLNERWLNLGQGSLLVGASIVRLSTTGAFTSRSTYDPQDIVYFSDPPGPCPDINVQQSDGRVIFKGTNSDELFRFSTNFATTQTMSCSSYSSMGSPTPAVLQSDDKMIAAGRYNGNIAIVRTLP